MISRVNSFNWNTKTAFGENKNEVKTLAADQQLKKKKPEKEEDALLENNLVTRLRIMSEKFTKAFTIYPARGLKGSKNSNFYEYLTIGSNVPSLIGSVMLMSIFNSCNKWFEHFGAYRAFKLGNKMALGVIFYTLFKEGSKSLINLPVKLKTGIDTELPYKKVNNLLQEAPDDFDLTSIEYHKVGESVDFAKWDILYGDTQKGEKVNFRFDKIAKKNGLGENLNDSDQEVKPIYREVLAKSKVAKSISSFLWGAVGVGFAFQDAWLDYCNAATLKFWKGKDFMHSLKIFRQSFVRAAESLYKGDRDPSAGKIGKHSGKALLGVAALTTLLGVLNTCHIKNKPSKLTASDVMDKKKEYVVG